MTDFTSALREANNFNAKIFGVDPNDEPFFEMCTLDVALDAQSGHRVRQNRISYTFDDDWDIEHTTLREITVGPKGRGDCPSYVTLAYLTPDMTVTQRSEYCLVYDRSRKLIQGFAKGAQDAYRVCKSREASFCQKVNDTRDEALAIAGFASGVVGGVTGTAVVNGTTVVAHSSGAWILTGGSGYVAGTLGTIGTTLVGILSAPILIGATVVSVVGVGGAVYVCAGR